MALFINMHSDRFLLLLWQSFLVPNIINKLVYRNDGESHKMNFNETRVTTGQIKV